MIFGFVILRKVRIIIVDCIIFVFVWSEIRSVQLIKRNGDLVASWLSAFTISFSDLYIEVLKLLFSLLFFAKYL